MPDSVWLSHFTTFSPSLLYGSLPVPPSLFPDCLWINRLCAFPSGVFNLALTSLVLQHLSYGNGSLHVDAAFQQTLWSVAPICSGSEVAQGTPVCSCPSLFFSLPSPSLFLLLLLAACSVLFCYLICFLSFLHSFIVASCILHKFTLKLNSKSWSLYM